MFVISFKNKVVFKRLSRGCMFNWVDSIMISIMVVIIVSSNGILVSISYRFWSNVVIEVCRVWVVFFVFFVKFFFFLVKMMFWEELISSFIFVLVLWWVRVLRLLFCVLILGISRKCFGVIFWIFLNFFGWVALMMYIRFLGVFYFCVFCMIFLYKGWLFFCWLNWKFWLFLLEVSVKRIIYLFLNFRNGFIEFMFM